jgi:hypothetical protein
MAYKLPVFLIFPGSVFLIAIHTGKYPSSHDAFEITGSFDNPAVFKD